MNRMSSASASGPALPEQHGFVLWASGQCDNFVIDETELATLQAIAAEPVDRRTGRLLQHKLRSAKVRHPLLVPLDTVVINSMVDFTYGSQREVATIVDGTAASVSSERSVGSLLGAGLIGLSAGHHVLWPDEQGELQSLVVHSVERGPKITTGKEARCRGTRG